MNEAFFNVSDYGTQGDGLALDTTAIQGAIDNCVAAGGATVYSGIKKPAWKLLRGKRFTATFKIKAGPRKREQEVGLKIIKVFHTGYGYGLCPLWLVVSSSGKGREPWYLLTNEPIATVKDAQNIVLAYGRRWQSKVAFVLTRPN